MAIALFTSLSLAVLSPLLSRLSDRTIALVAMGLLALDPLLIGHSGLLHTDALRATFTIVTVVTALNGLHRPRQVAWWPVAGVFAGLAFLTTSPAVILFGFVVLLLSVNGLTSVVRESSTARGWLQATVAVAAARYPLNHFNPRLGGLPTGSPIVPTGWGEGWSVEAGWLNRLPDAEQLTAAVESGPSFSAICEGRRLALDDDAMPLADHVVQDGVGDAPAGFGILVRFPFPAPIVPPSSPKI